MIAPAARGGLGEEVARLTGPVRMRSVVVATSRDPNAKATVLLFRPGARWPELALKVPATAAAEAAVEREARLLEELHQRDLGPVRPTVPRVVDRVRVGGRTALLMTAIPGSPMLRVFLRWRGTRTPRAVERDFRLAGAWLSALRARTAGGTAPAPAGDLAARLRARFAGRPGAAEAAELAARLRAGLEPADRTAAVHGDLWAGNLLVAGHGLGGVVDWELGALAGDPARDLVHFALTYALYLDRATRPGRRVAGHPGLRAGPWGGGIAYALDGEGWFPDLVRRFLRDGLADLGVAPERWRAAALNGLAEAAATADHEEFAGRHLDLLLRLGRAEAGR